MKEIFDYLRKQDKEYEKKRKEYFKKLLYIEQNIF